MPIYVSFSSTGGKRFLKTGSSLVHGVSHGDNPLKPKDVASLQFGYSVLSPRNVSVGKALGKRQPKPIKVSREVDQASPLLWSASCNSEVFPQLKINFQQLDSKGAKQPYLGINLTNATLVGITRKHQSYSGTTETHEEEEIAFIFQKISIENLMKSNSAADDWDT